MNFNKQVQDKAPDAIQKKQSESQSGGNLSENAESPLLQMYSAIGNRGTAQLMTETVQMKSGKSFSSLIQRIEEEEEPIQGLEVEEEEILQGKDEEPLQMKSDNTGLPENLKTGVESLSGVDMADVKVNYNSSKPEKVGALAYTQGSDIHVGPGQEKHLPHEAWHVAQQKDGRVKPTTEVNGAAVNDDPALEKEADLMGSKAVQMSNSMQEEQLQMKTSSLVSQQMPDDAVQRMPIQMKSKMQEEIEARVGGETASKDQVFEAFVSILKSKGFRYESETGNNDINNTFSSANCGWLSRALNDMFEVFTGEKASPKYTQNIYVDIDGDYIDSSVDGNCKKSTGETIPAYFFRYHSYLDGYDPTTGKKSPSESFSADLKPMSDFESVLPEGKEFSEKQSDYAGYYDYGNFYILKEAAESEKRYVKMDKGRFFSEIETLDLLKDKV